jgi:bilin biosynthesis protein
MSQFSARAIDPAQTDAIIEVVTQQITLLTFDNTDTDTLHRLINCLADPREESQITLTQLFGEIGEAATELLLLALQNHPIARVRRGCARALAKVRDPFSVPGLIQALSTDSNPWVKSAAASALVAIGSPAVLDLLDLVTISVDPQINGQASWALAHMDPETLPIFQSAINSPVGSVRAAIITAVGAILKSQTPRFPPSNSVLDLLYKGLNDLEAQVRSEAVSALSSLSLSNSSTAILPLLNDSDESVRRVSAIALGKLRDRTTLPALVTASKTDKSLAVRTLAKIAIGQITE